MSEFEQLYANGEFKTLVEITEGVSSSKAKYYHISALWRLGEIELACDLAVNYLHSIEPGDPFFGKITNRLGTIYIDLGDYDLALDSFQQAHQHALQLGLLDEQASSMNNQGIVHRMKGNYEEALKYFEHSRDLFEIQGDTRFVAFSLNNISIIYRNLGDFDKALLYLNQGNDLLDKYGNSFDRGYTKGSLIELYLSVNNSEKASIYLDELKKISETENNRILIILYHINKAYCLKASKRGRDKILALTQLEDLLGDIDFDTQIKLDVMFNIIELLIKEYQIFNEEDVISKIHQLLDEIYDLSSKQRLFPSLIQAILVNAKLESIKGEFNKANDLIVSALKIAQENNLQQLIKEINEEQIQMENQFSSIQKMISNNESMSKRLAESKIIDYLNHIKKNISR